MASRRKIAIYLAGAVIVLLVLGFFGEWFAPLLGHVGVQFRGYLHMPLFELGQVPITTFFLIKIAIFLLLLGLMANFSLTVLQRRVLVHTPLAVGQQYAVARVLSYLIFVAGLVIGLESLGLNLSSLVVLGGALGLGVGLGLQTVVSNFVAGLILLFEQSIRMGDRIEVGETYGDVVRMRGRSTWVRTNDNVIIIVPNSQFIEKPVINWTVNDRQVRISLPVGVGYGSDPAVVRERLLSVAAGNPDVLKEPPPEVIFTEFGDNSLNFDLRVWTEQQVHTPLRLKSHLYFAIFEDFKQAGLELPFPQRDLRLRSVDEGVTEMLAAAIERRSGPGSAPPGPASGARPQS